MKKQMSIQLGKMVICTATLAAAFNVQAESWILNGKPNVGFYIQHLGVKTVDATFRQVRSSFTFNPEQLQSSKVEFVMDVNSLSLTKPSLKSMVLGTDFFNASKYPKATFTSTSVKENGNSKYAIQGNLTLRGITKPVVFNTTITPAQNAKNMNVTATTDIRRSDFGMKPAVGGVGETVHIHMQGSLKPQ